MKIATVVGGRLRRRSQHGLPQARFSVQLDRPRFRILGGVLGAGVDWCLGSSVRWGVFWRAAGHARVRLHSAIRPFRVLKTYR